MQSGLVNDTQKEAASRWIDSEVERARHDIEHPPQQGDYDLLSDYQKAKEKAESNPFYNKVKEIKDFSGDDEEKLEGNLQRLKTDSLATMEKGVPPKGLFENLGESFSNFDIFNPIGSLMNVVKQAVKGMALAMGGEMLAPWLKSMKSKIMGDPMSPEEAAQNLNFQNASKALAGSLGIDDPNAQEQFAQATSDQLDDVASKKSAPNPTAPAGKRPSAGDGKEAEEGRGEDAARGEAEPVQGKKTGPEAAVGELPPEAAERVRSEQQVRDKMNVSGGEDMAVALNVPPKNKPAPQPSGEIVLS